MNHKERRKASHSDRLASFKARHAELHGVQKCQPVPVGSTITDKGVFGKNRFKHFASAYTGSKSFSTEDASD